VTGVFGEKEVSTPKTVKLSAPGEAVAKMGLLGVDQSCFGGGGEGGRIN